MYEVSRAKDYMRYPTETGYVFVHSSVSAP